MADKTDSVSIQLKELLDEYNENLHRLVRKTSQSCAKETASDLRSTSAAMFGNGPYAKGWTVKEEKGGYIVHNSTNYQLTHLLENGHVIVNGHGEYGRAPAYRHIGPAEKRGIVRFEEEIEQGANKI